MNCLLPSFPGLVKMPHEHAKGMMQLLYMRRGTTLGAEASSLDDKCLCDAVTYMELLIQGL